MTGAERQIVGRRLPERDVRGRSDAGAASGAERDLLGAAGSMPFALSAEQIAPEAHRVALERRTARQCASDHFNRIPVRPSADRPSVGAFRGYRRATARTTQAWVGGGRGAGTKAMALKCYAMADPVVAYLMLLVHEADMQNRDGALPLLINVRRRHPLRDARGCRRRMLQRRDAGATLVGTETLHKHTDQPGFVVDSRPQVGERTLVWRNRQRRLPNEFARTTSSATAFLNAPAAKPRIHPLIHHT